MIYRILLPPQELATIPTEAYSQRLFCNFWIGLFHDLIVNGVVVLPGEHVRQSDYFNALDSWPQKYRNRAQLLLALLNRKGRFVLNEIPADSECHCPRVPCRPYVNLSLLRDDIQYLRPEACFACVSARKLSARTISTLDYFASESSPKHRCRIAQIVSDGQWTSDKFEEIVLRPVLRDAKSIKIVDRWIGRSGMSRNGKAMRFQERYTKCLDWIASVYADLEGLKRCSLFEVYCGVSGDVNDAHWRQVCKAEVIRLETEMQRTTGLPVKIIMKAESASMACPHGRYLITEQVGLLIDRGFDLLWNDRRMSENGLDPSRDKRRIRDVAVTVCDDHSSVESQIRLLPNLF